jgi:RNA polymerase sigma-70 factor (ECF subfamily)
VIHAVRELNDLTERTKRDDRDDHRLAVAAQADARAFEPLYLRYVDPIYRFCYRRLGAREDAEDATSLVFSKALASIESYRAGSFRAWLFTIADRATIDRIRRHRPTHPLEDATSIADPGDSPEAIAIDADARRDLRRLLRQLTTDQRRVIEFRLSGLDGPEIAAAMHRDLNAIHALQFRAMERLRRVAAADRGERAYE